MRRSHLAVISLSLLVIASDPIPPDWLIIRVLPFTRLVYRAEPEIDPAIVLSVIAVESMGNVDMVGAHGEIGPMQVMPRSWTGTVQQLQDELYNIRTGVNILEQNIEDYGLEDGLAYYNCGPRSLESACGDGYAELVMEHLPAFREALEGYEPRAYLWDAAGIRLWLEAWGY